MQTFIDLFLLIIDALYLNGMISFDGNGILFQRIWPSVIV